MTHVILLIVVSHMMFLTLSKCI